VTTKYSTAPVAKDTARPLIDRIEIKPLYAKMSSVYRNSYPAINCIDGNTTNNKICVTAGKESYPWVTLVIPHSIVTKVRITNRKDWFGERMKNMKIWVGEKFPSTTKVEYTGGALLGTFKGPGTKGQVVEFFSKAKEASTHVVVQMETDYINLLEIEVFGFPKPGCMVEQNMDYYGFDIPNKQGSATSQIDCANRCARETLCQFWTFVPSTKLCMLKLSDSNRRGNGDRVSGQKACGMSGAPCIDTGCKKTGVADDVKAECVYLKNVNWTSISHIYNVSTPWKEGLCKGADSKEDCCKCLPRLPVGCVDVKNACKDAFGGWGVCKNFVKDDMSAIDFEQGSKKNLCNVAEPDCCECFSLKKTKTTKP